MLLNFFKTAFRNLVREKGSSFINIFGLTLGLTCGIVIFLIIKFQLSYDTFHSNYDNIYRIVSQITTPEGEFYNEGALPRPFIEAFRNDFPEVSYASMTELTSGLFKVETDNGSILKFNEDDGVVYAEPEYFKIFDTEWIAGNPETALDGPGKIVITKSTAVKYFGSVDILGRIINFDNKADLEVTGVIEDFPENTDLPFNIMISLDTFIQQDPERMTWWGSISTNTNVYIALSENISPKTVNERLKSFVEKYNPPKPPRKLKYFLQPLSELHYDTRIGTYSAADISHNSLIALGVIGIFLVVIASINFINITTAQAVRRAREIGIRKVLGSSRFKLVLQLFSEIFLITLLSALFAIALTELLMPAITSFLNLNFSADIFGDPVILVFLLGLIMFVTLLSGSYPAIVLSGLRPVKILQRRMSDPTGGGLLLRRVLVTLQFIISTALIISTIIVLFQMNFMKNKSLGFDKGNTVIVTLPGSDSLKHATLGQRLALVPGVEEVSLSFSPPISDLWYRTSLMRPGWDESRRIGTEYKSIDPGFLDFYNIDLLAGRNIRHNEPETNVIVNESLVKLADLGSPAEAVGKNITLSNHYDCTIIGVVRDFHFHPLFTEIDAQVMLNRSEIYRVANIKLLPGSEQVALKSIENEWSALFPEYLFNYTFFDDFIENFYSDEAQIADLFQAFALIAILISMLGLYGLISFIANRRTKEIGIKKVLGASVGNILIPFVKEFMLLLFGGFLIAAPASYFYMKSWLQEYAYKIEIGAVIFIVSALLVSVISIITIGYRAWKAASLNPVDAIRYE